MLRNRLRESFRQSKQAAKMAHSARGSLKAYPLLSFVALNLLREFKDERSNLIIAQKFLEQNIPFSEQTFRVWHHRVRMIEEEGFWEPVVIKDVRGWLDEVGRTEKGDSKQRGEHRKLLMQTLLELIGGTFSGNSFRSPQRGLSVSVLRAELRNRIKNDTYFSELIAELIQMGALRRTKVAKSILMIPTAKQMTELFDKTGNVGGDDRLDSVLSSRVRPKPRR